MNRSQKHVRALVMVLGWSVLGWSCGGSGGSGSSEIDGELTAITIEPASATITIGSTQAGAQDFTVTGTYENGGTADVTDEAVFSVVEPVGIGSFEGATFVATNTYGGPATVQAKVGNLSASAVLTLLVQNISVVQPASGTPVPANPQNLFDGSEDTSRAPELVYPNDGVLLPPNMDRVEIHWLRGPVSNTLFEVSFINALTDLRVYMRCERPAGVQEDGCVWEAAEEIWDYIAETNRGNEPLTVQVRATDDQGTGVGTSNTTAMEWTSGNVNGTIYYWAVSTGEIVRYDFGEPAGMATSILGPSIVQEPTGTKCVGCHTISHDGYKIATSATGGGGGFILYQIDQALALRNSSLNTDEIMAFAAFSPDDSQLAMVRNVGNNIRGADGLDLVDTRCTAETMSTCGQKVDNIALGGAIATHPDWAADGSRIAFTKSAIGFPHAPEQGTISYIEPSGASWGPVQDWVTRITGSNYYNPKFSPDSSFVIFNKSTCAVGTDSGEPCNGYTDLSAQLMAVTKGSTTPVDLTKANAQGVQDASGQLANTFPGLAPFTSTFKRSNPEQIMWLTFSSIRKYGLKQPPVRPNTSTGAPPETPVGAWIWMTAIRKSELEAGKDPSFPAFALPFQDFSTFNHVVVWTTFAVPTI